MKKRVLILASLLTLILVGCNTNKETNTPVESSVASAPVETATPEPTAEPTPNQGEISGYEVTDQESTEQDSDVNSTSDNVVLGDDEYKGDDPNDLANKPDSDDDKSLVDKALEVEDPDADSGLTVGPDGYATDGLGVDLDGDGVITNFEKSFWEGVMGRTPSYPTGDGNTGGSSTTTPDGGSYVPGPTGQQGGIVPGATGNVDGTGDDGVEGSLPGQGDYTGLEGGTVY